MAIGLRLSASGVALVVGQGKPPKKFTPPTESPTSNFTVSFEPANPYVGEALKVRIEGFGGHAVPNPLRTNPNAVGDVWVQTNVDDAGATFETTGDSAATAYGRIFGHVYTTPGVKNLTISSWVFDGDNKTQNFSVTVIDPETESWDQDWAVDFSGNTVGMPAGATQITSYAAFAALRNTTSPGQKIRIRFRGGVTHALTAATNWLQSAGVVYVSTFGTGKATITGFGAVFTPGTTNTRYIINNIRFEGPYDIHTGAYNASGLMTAYDTSQTDSNVTLFKCEGYNLDKFFAGGGTNSLDRRYQPCVIDCDVRNWQDYSVFSGACRFFIVRGCTFYQHPTASMGDTKPGTDPDYGNHTPIRISRYQYLGISQNRIISNVGWTPGGASFSEMGIQDSLRIYINDNPAGSFGVVIGNHLQSRVFFEYGTANDTGDIPNTFPLLFACNQCEYGHQASEAANLHAGGVYMYSNLIYRPNLHRNQDDPALNILDIEASSLNASNAAWQEPGYCGFNTMFSDISGAVQAGGTIGGVVTQLNNGLPSDYLVEHNLISGDNNIGSYITSAAFSRGDNFRPITAGAADGTVTNGPPVDIDFVKRTSPTNIGCHHAAGADVSVPAPTHSGAAPTIGPAKTGQYAVTDVGTGWGNISNIGSTDLQWQLDGANAPATLQAYSRNYTSGGSGNLRCIVGRTNRSGQRVTAISNTLAI